jgi:hypothetical protein
MPRKSYREKHKEKLNQKDRERYQRKKSEQQVRAKQEPTPKPVISEDPIQEQTREPELKSDCERFRKMIAGDLPRDGFFCANHDVICKSCNAFRIHFEHGEESDFPKEHADPFHASGESPEDLEFPFEKSTRTPNPDVEKYNPKYPIEEHEPKTEQDERLDPQAYIEQTFQRKQKQQPETQDDNQTNEDDSNVSDNQ